MKGEKIQWREELSVGVEELDQEHRMLFDILDRLEYTITHNREKRELAIILGEFIFYAERHFQTEENYMRSISYDGLDEHIRDHERVRDYIEQMKDEYNRGNYKITHELADFIREWIDKHMEKEDQKFVHFREMKRN